MKENKSIIELEEGLRKMLEGLDKDVDKIIVLFSLAKYTVFMEQVQKLPQLLRLIYWEGAFVIFTYLWRNKQLGRNEGEFDAGVKNNLYFIIDKLLSETENEYGRD